MASVVSNVNVCDAAALTLPAASVDVTETVFEPFVFNASVPLSKSAVELVSILQFPSVAVVV